MTNSQASPAVNLLLTGLAEAKQIDDRSNERVNCPICGQNASFAYAAGDYHYDNPGVFRVYSCGTCSHLFQHPAPDKETLLGYYPKTYYAHGSVRTDFTLRGLRGFGVRLLAHYCQRYRGYRHLSVSGNLFLAFLGRMRLIRNRRDLIIPVYVPGGSVCDFGCGSGKHVAFLRYFGWNAEGIEVSRDAVEAGRKAGLNITAGSSDILEGRPQAFDVIRSSHCVEHVADVQRLFRAFFVAMKPGGILAIEVPNSASAAAQAFRDRFFYLGVPVHLHLFSPQSLYRIAEEAGFTRISLRTVTFWSTHAASWLLSRDMQKGRKALNLERYSKLALVVARLATIGVFLRSAGGRGDCLILSCQRPISCHEEFK